MLSDEIEKFIKVLLREGEDDVALQRKELALHFACAPSQINYVLSTRFTFDHGYFIESRRGGGGFIRIIRVKMNDTASLLSELIGRIGPSIPQEECYAIIQNLRDRDVVDEKSAALMRAASDAQSMQIPAAAKDYVRAGVLKNLLEALMLWESREEG